MSDITDECIREVSLIFDTFPNGVHVAYSFIERVYEQCISGPLKAALTAARRDHPNSYVTLAYEFHQTARGLSQAICEQTRQQLSMGVLDDFVDSIFGSFCADLYQAERDLLEGSLRADVQSWQVQQFGAPLSKSKGRSRHLEHLQKRLLGYRSSEIRLAELQASSAEELGLVELPDASQLRPAEIVSVDLALSFVQRCKAAVERQLWLDRTPHRKMDLVHLFGLMSKFLGRHLQVALRIGIKKLETTLPGPQTPDADPTVQFFDLVQIIDMVQQTVVRFYEDELLPALGRSEAVDAAARKKAMFEKALDLLVADGMHKAIDVVVAQVAYTLKAEQRLDVFDVKSASSDALASTSSVSLEKTPSSACMKCCEYLQRYFSVMFQCFDPATLDVLLLELGQRLFKSVHFHRFLYLRLIVFPQSHSNTFAVFRNHTCGCPALSLVSLRPYARLWIWYLTVFCFSDAEYYLENITRLNCVKVHRQFSALCEVARLFEIAPEEMPKYFADTAKFRDGFTEEELRQALRQRPDYRVVARHLPSDRCKIT